MLENARDAKVRSYLTEIAQEYERLAKIAEGGLSAIKDTPGKAPER
ncbi:MAG TPA: hypothetical protein VN656_16445 [Stellaceae bacterium]|jgi:hypothetical protein|nr:hypothetical protein [Stellaceae bacterium]